MNSLALIKFITSYKSLCTAAVFLISSIQVPEQMRCLLASQFHHNQVSVRTAAITRFDVKGFTVKIIMIFKKSIFWYSFLGIIILFFMFQVWGFVELSFPSLAQDGNRGSKPFQGCSSFQTEIIEF